MNSTPPQIVNGDPNGHAPSRSGSLPSFARRRPQSSNPLVASRKPQRSKLAPGKTTGSSVVTTHQHIPVKSDLSGQPPLRTGAFAQRPPSPEPAGVLKKIPVYLNEKALSEALRCHVARMQAKFKVDISDQEMFTRPIRLHRRDPTFKAEDGEEDISEPVKEIKDTAKSDEKEAQRERLEATKAEIKRIKEEHQKLIAPSEASISRKKVSKKRKFQQIFRPNDTPEEQKKNRVKYEEAYPWHIEDDDNKQIWMGAYEETLSESHLLLVREGDVAKVVPLEKYYRFKERSKVPQMDVDDVFKRLTEKSHEVKFIQHRIDQKRIQAAKEEQSWDRRFARKGGAKFAGTSGKGVNNEDADRLFTNEDIPEGAEEQDFENDDLFDDDDGDGPVLEGDNEEILKERLAKIKKEQLGANIFDMVDEEDVDKEEEVETKRVEYTRKTKKKMKKALIKREQNFNYHDDSSDENPYSSESEEDESDIEAEVEGEDGKSPEKKGEQSSSIKGDTTPSGRKKNSSISGKVSSRSLEGDVEMSEASGNESSRKKNHKLKVPNLKRPGSPDASGASGNESSRKKQKLSNLNPGSIKIATNRKVSALRAGAGSGSESESTKRLKNKSKNTPSGSRATSPGAQSNGSRSGSPSVYNTELPSAQEIVALIPPEGIKMNQLVKDLLKKYPGGGQARIAEIVNLIKAAAIVMNGTVTRRA